MVDLKPILEIPSVEEELHPGWLAGFIVGHLFINYLEITGVCL